LRHHSWQQHHDTPWLPSSLTAAAFLQKLLLNSFLERLLQRNGRRNGLRCLPWLRAPPWRWRERERERETNSPPLSPPRQNFVIPSTLFKGAHYNFWIHVVQNLRQIPFEEPQVPCEVTPNGANNRVGISTRSKSVRFGGEPGFKNRFENHE